MKATAEAEVRNTGRKKYIDQATSCSVLRTLQRLVRVISLLRRSCFGPCCVPARTSQHLLSCYTYDMSTTQFQAPFQRLMDAIAGAVPLGLEQIATSLTTKKPATGWARLPLMALARVGRRAQVIRIPRNPHTQSAQSATLSTQPAEVVLRVYNLAPCLARYRAFTILGCLSLVLKVLTFLSMCNVFSYCMCTRTHVRA